VKGRLGKKRYLLWQHAEPERLYESEETAEDADKGFDHEDPERGF